jgi:hypothetical protein
MKELRKPQETSVDFQETTRRYILENKKLHNKSRLGYPTTSSRIRLGSRNIKQVTIT